MEEEADAPFSKPCDADTHSRSVHPYGSGEYVAELVGEGVIVSWPEVDALPLLLKRDRLALTQTKSVQPYGSTDEEAEKVVVAGEFAGAEIVCPPPSKDAEIDTQTKSAQP